MSCLSFKLGESYKIKETCPLSSTVPSAYMITRGMPFLSALRTVDHMYRFDEQAVVAEQKGVPVKPTCSTSLIVEIGHQGSVSQNRSLGMLSSSLWYI
jgi:hypothetical protein